MVCGCKSTEILYILRSRRDFVCRLAWQHMPSHNETIGEIAFTTQVLSIRLDSRRWNCGDALIFEVRGHDLNVSLIHREKLARLTFYRMSEDAKAEESSGDKTVYNEQELKLSSYFGDWPDALTANADGSISPK